MAKRSAVLIAALAFAFICMCCFLAWHNDSSLQDMAGPALFGVLLVAVAFITIIKPDSVSSAIPRSALAKQLFGAFALAFASWMLCCVLALPIFGYAGFELMDRPWFSLAFLVLAAAFFPVTRRFLK